MDTFPSDPTTEYEHQIRVKYRGYFVIIAVISLLIGGIIGYGTMYNSEYAPPELTPPPHWGNACIAQADYTPWPTVTPHPVRVYVSGAVQQPQVISLPPGSSVQDAIRAVGGVTTNADLDQLNLAAPLADYQHILVPTREATAPPTTAEHAAQSPTGLLDLNTATVTKLTTLPNIGPVLAQRIVDYREEHGPFQSCRELLNVSGIGTAKYHDVESYITVTVSGGNQ